AEPAERPRLARYALQRRYLLVYRTLADPRYLDPTLDPSERPLGSIFSFGRDPVVGNYGDGLARAMSARGWLSTWSAPRPNSAATGRSDRRVMPAAAAERALARLTIGHYMLRRWSLEEDVRHLERLGFRSISLASTKFDAYGPARAIRLLRASSLRVAHLGSYGRFGTERQTIRRGIDRVRRAIEHLHQLGGDALFVLSGGREGTSWERAAGVDRDAYAALLPEATAAGIRLAIEVIHPLRQDISFINMLVDAREIARAAGRRGGYVLDFFHSGWERRLLDTIRRDARRRIHAVQMCAHKR